MATRQPRPEDGLDLGLEIEYEFEFMEEWSDRRRMAFVIGVATVLSGMWGALLSLIGVV